MNYKNEAEKFFAWWSARVNSGEASGLDDYQRHVVERFAGWLDDSSPKKSSFEVKVDYIKAQLHAAEAVLAAGPGNPEYNIALEFIGKHLLRSQYPLREVKA